MTYLVEQLSADPSTLAGALPRLGNVQMNITAHGTVTKWVACVHCIIFNAFVRADSSELLQDIPVLSSRRDTHFLATPTARHARNAAPFPA